MKEKGATTCLVSCESAPTMCLVLNQTLGKQNKQKAALAFTYLIISLGQAVNGRGGGSRKAQGRLIITIYSGKLRAHGEPSVHRSCLRVTTQAQRRSPARLWEHLGPPSTCHCPQEGVRSLVVSSPAAHCPPRRQAGAILNLQPRWAQVQWGCFSLLLEFRWLASP